MITEHSLSVGQEALWFLYCMRPDDCAFNGATPVLIPRRVDADRLGRALRLVAERHSMLRSTFASRPAGPIRLVADDRVPPLDVRASADVTEAGIAAIVEELAARPFDLEKDVPFRFTLTSTAAESVLVLTAHHIAMDVTAQMLLLRDLLQEYAALSRGDRAELPAAADYDEFVADEQALLAGPRRTRAEAYWRELCLPLPPDLTLRPGRTGPAPTASATERVSYGPEFSDRLDTAARSAGVTPFVYLFTIFQIQLYRETRQEDFLLGYTASTRLRPRSRNTVGYLVNTPPYRVRLDPDATFTEVLAGCGRQLGSALPHLNYPFALLPGLLRAPRSRDRAPLVQVLFNFLPGKPFDLSVEDAPVTPLPGCSPPGGYDLIVEAVQRRTESIVSIQYKTHLFDAGPVRAMASGLGVLFDRFSRAPESGILS
ncbi:condensation domain-containing protein [Actinoplanes couchii]|uniref:Condensation domain-containing protein n=1 Tax=Actinoplanes couchii TaxID=403638 RepID=A0ABQ3XSJ8_9ACTN|nr:condensation domain-containing protein [Actinoplanes couchii]MDR6315976.1 hypothetical protein [Actinoplanes couchii]GID61494.1 hypothetical protein Aco03nite_098980 [Actinoplanes couchii]